MVTAVILLLATIVLLIISIICAVQNYNLMNEGEDKERIGYFSQGLLGTFAGAICSIFAFIGIFAAVGIMAGKINPSHEAERARCSSVEGTTFGDGHCYKNGIELTWGEHNV